MTNTIKLGSAGILLLVSLFGIALVMQPEDTATGQLGINWKLCYFPSEDIKGPCLEKQRAPLNYKCPAYTSELGSNVQNELPLCDSTYLGRRTSIQYYDTPPAPHKQDYIKGGEYQPPEE